MHVYPHFFLAVLQVIGVAMVAAQLETSQRFLGQSGNVSLMNINDPLLPYTTSLPGSVCCGLNAAWFRVDYYCQNYNVSLPNLL